MKRRSLLLAPLALTGCAGLDSFFRDIPARIPDAPAIMSPDFMVEEVLKLAEVRPGDTLYDLGCGDGRIVVEAARRGARAIGVDIDPRQIRLAVQRAEAAKIGERARFITGDLFTLNIGDATVVTLYLGEEVNIRLMPKLRRELKPGTRVVSHEFGMGLWEPETRIVVGGRYLYRWII